MVKGSLDVVTEGRQVLLLLLLLLLLFISNVPSRQPHGQLEVTREHNKLHNL